MDKSIVKIPSFAAVRRHVYEAIKTRDSEKLVYSLAVLGAYKTAYLRNLLPGDFYNACSYGPIPRDPWLLHNAEYAIEELEKELQARNFDYCIWVEIPLKKAG